MCNRGTPFLLLPRSVLLLPLKELLSEVCTCRSFVLLQTSNHGTAPEIVHEAGDGAGSELRWSSGYIAVVPRVLFKELFVPGISGVPLAPRALSVCFGSPGMPEVPSVSSVWIPAVPHWRRGRSHVWSVTRAAVLTARLIPAPAQVWNGLSSFCN